MMKHFPYVEDWMALCIRHTGIKKFRNVTFLLFYQRTKYLGTLICKTKDIFSPAAITSLCTDDSFIEFEDDKKYTYKTGYSYLIKVVIVIEYLILSKTNRYIYFMCSSRGKSICLNG